MQGECLYCGVEQNLTERLCKGLGCRACDAPLKQALAEILVDSFATMFAFSENDGCTSLAVRAMQSLAGLGS